MSGMSLSRALPPPASNSLHSENRFYRGGLSTLHSESSKASNYLSSAIYDPYPDYNSKNWRKSWVGEFRPCEGPRGADLDRTDVRDMMMVYPGLQKGTFSPLASLPRSSRSLTRSHPQTFPAPSWALLTVSD